MSYKEYQPLRISGDWKVEWNCFFEVEPSKETMSYFAKDLLFITSDNRKRAIELQWQPEDNPNGEFVLKVINLQETYNKATKSYFNVGDWENTELVFTSKNRLDVVDKLENLIFSLDIYKDERIFKSRGIIDEKLETLRLDFLLNGSSEDIIIKIFNAKHSILENLLLDDVKVKKKTLEYLKENGVTKGIRNKANQKLKSSVFNSIKKLP